MSGPPLNDVLRDLGLRSLRTGAGFPASTRHICAAGTRRPIFTGTAGEVWAWLREAGAYPAAAEEHAS